MEYYRLHPQDPEKRFLNNLVKILEDGGMIICPSDSGYCIAANVGSKQALKKFYKLRETSDKSSRTLLFKDMRQVTEYATVENFAYKYMKPLIPGPFTFILPATNHGKKILEARRPEMGVKFPSSKFMSHLLESSDYPLIIKSMFDSETGISEIPEPLNPFLKSAVSALADMGPLNISPSTIVDFTNGQPELIRQGEGIVYV